MVPFTFRIWVSHWTHEPSFEFVPAEPGIRQRASRRSVCGRTACTDRGGGGRKPDQSGQHVPRGPGASRRPYNMTGWRCSASLGCLTVGAAERLYAGQPELTRWPRRSQSLSTIAVIRPGFRFGDKPTRQHASYTMCQRTVSATSGATTPIIATWNTWTSVISTSTLTAHRSRRRVEAG